jgi:hypothetical protein
MSLFELVQAIQSAGVGVVGEDDMEGGGRPSKRRKVETRMSNLQIESCLKDYPATVCCADELPARVGARPRTFIVNTDTCDVAHLPCRLLHGLAIPLLASASDRIAYCHQTCPFDLKVYRLLAYPFGLDQCLFKNPIDRQPIATLGRQMYP